jgi:hypothetical protein
MVPELAPEKSAYALVHEMAKDVVRFIELVMEARCEANMYSYDGQPVFPRVSDNLYVGEYIYDPAMERYLELYGGEAVTLREGAIDWEAYEYTDTY